VNPTVQKSSSLLAAFFVALLFIILVRIVKAVPESLLFSTSQASVLYASEMEKSGVVSHLGGAAQAVDIQGDYAFMATRGELTVLDISDPLIPTRTGYLRISANDVVAKEHAVYMTGQDGFHIVDTHNPSHPQLLGSVPTRQIATGLALVSDLAYVVDHLGGLTIIDIADSLAPRQLSYTDIDGILRDVEVNGSYAYIASNEGLSIYDISDSAAPALIDFRDTFGSIYALAATADYLYLGGDSSLTIVDLTSDVLKQVATIETKEIVWDIQLHDEYAHLAMGSRGMGIIDISEPSQALMTGFVYLAGIALGLDSVGELTFVAVGDRGLRVVDSSSPGEPLEVGAYRAPGFVWGMDVANGYAYLAADWDGNLHIIDVTDPLQPHEVGFAYTNGHAQDVTVAYP
jgi:hypothetical protein